MGLLRRNRTDRRPYSETVERSEHDAQIFSALARYGRLNSHHLYELDDGRTIQGSKYRANRWHHNTKTWPAVKVPLIREQTHQTGWNNPVLYRAGLGLPEYLRQHALYSDEQIRWMPATKIGAPHDTTHNLNLANAVADIEIACRKAGLKFRSHLDILKSASPEAREERNPLDIPLGTVQWKDFPPLKDVSLQPDALFAIEYPEGVRFFFVEYDMGTENVNPGSSLSHASWLRKIVLYKHASKGAVKHWLNIPNFYVLIMYPHPRPHGSITNAIEKVCPEGSSTFCLQPHPEIPSTVIYPKYDDRRFKTDWQRVGREPLNLQRI